MKPSSLLQWLGILLGEKLAGKEILGLAFVFLGVTIVQFKKRAGSSTIELKELAQEDDLQQLMMTWICIHK
jgi:drug/metabolite transporter (DMT)-like permease